jgi:hypothetical protein
MVGGNPTSTDLDIEHTAGTLSYGYVLWGSRRLFPGQYTQPELAPALEARDDPGELNPTGRQACLAQNRFTSVHVL